MYCLFLIFPSCFTHNMLITKSSRYQKTMRTSDEFFHHRLRKCWLHRSDHEQAFQMERPLRQLYDVSDASLSQNATRLTFLLIDRILVRIRRIRSLPHISTYSIPPLSFNTTHNHLLILANSNSLPLHDLHIVQSTQNLMLNLELRSHAELDSLLYSEWLLC